MKAVEDAGCSYWRPRLQRARHFPRRLGAAKPRRSCGDAAGRSCACLGPSLLEPVGGQCRKAGTGRRSSSSGDPCLDMLRSRVPGMQRLKRIGKAGDWLNLSRAACDWPRRTHPGQVPGAGLPVRGAHVHQVVEVGGRRDELGAHKGVLQHLPAGGGIWGEGDMPKGEPPHPDPLPKRTHPRDGPRLRPAPQAREAPPSCRIAQAHLRRCCRCSSDTRKKKWRLLLVRNSWRRLLSVRSGMSNSSFSVGGAEGRPVLPSAQGPRPREPSDTQPHVNAHTPHPLAHALLTCQPVPEVGQADLLRAKEEQGALRV